MNGEDLVYDYRFNVVDDPSEWAFNWDYAECGTSKPTPRQHHATMWLTMNDPGGDPVLSMKRLFIVLSRKFPITMTTFDRGEQYVFRVTHKTTKAILFQGNMEKSDEPHDPNVGHYASFRSTTEKGTEIMMDVAANISHGHVALIPHIRNTIMKKDGYEVISITGEGPDDDNDGDEAEDDYGSKNLGTRFALVHDDDEVARCHMSYRDGSYDPSLGPTVEMIAVKESRRGEGLAKVLWYWVRRFVETHFALECLNCDAPLGHIMVKATQIGTEEVEMRQRKRDGAKVPVGFKEFLFDYCGFSVRIQKGAMAMFNRRPADEEAVLYIPLLSKEALAQKLLTDAVKAPKPGNRFLRVKIGARMCQYCREVGVDLLRCARCEVAFYCDGTCQKKDWKRHKKWCNKTREEVREKLIKEGGMTKHPDGSYSLCMNFGGMGI